MTEFDGLALESDSRPSRPVQEFVINCLLSLLFGGFIGALCAGVINHM